MKNLNIKLTVIACAVMVLAACGGNDSSDDTVQAEPKNNAALKQDAKVVAAYALVAADAPYEFSDTRRIFGGWMKDLSGSLWSRYIPNGTNNITCGYPPGYWEEFNRRVNDLAITNPDIVVEPIPPESVGRNLTWMDYDNNGVLSQGDTLKTEYTCTLIQDVSVQGEYQGTVQSFNGSFDPVTTSNGVQQLTTYAYSYSMNNVSVSNWGTSGMPPAGSYAYISALDGNGLSYSMDYSTSQDLNTTTTSSLLKVKTSQPLTVSIMTGHGTSSMVLNNIDFSAKDSIEMSSEFDISQMKFGPSYSAKVRASKQFNPTVLKIDTEKGDLEVYQYNDGQVKIKIDADKNGVFEDEIVTSQEELNDSITPARTP